MSNHLTLHYYVEHYVEHNYQSDIIYIRASRAPLGSLRVSIICELQCPARDKAHVFNRARAQIEQLALQHSSCRVAECYETAWWSPLGPLHSVATYRARDAIEQAAPGALSRVLADAARALASLRSANITLTSALRRRCGLRKRAASRWFIDESAAC